MPGGLTGGAGLGPSMKRELSDQIIAAQTASQQAESLLAAAASRESEMAAELAEAKQALHDNELRNAELVGRLAVTESTMIQRQEELAQLTAQFRDTERASTQAIANESNAREQLLDAKQRVAGATAQIEAMAQRSAAEREAAEVKIDRLQTEIVQINHMLQKQQEEAKVTEGARELAEEALAAQQEKTDQLDAELKQLQVAKQSLESARVVADQKLADRFSEIARLTAMLADESVKVDQTHANAEWLRSALQLAASFPKWWVIMPRKWRRKREHARYRNSGLLDAERYLEAYPDVAEYGMDPVRHYVLHGMGENRNIAIE
jgi:chromosome segregation ATPase